uniref:Uncharacterized protein n=1 Tax=Solanum lycopersicum TaxID=4081 RepID=A0A3Q7JB51_SOLLC
MDLSYNQLYGKVPESLCKVRTSEELTLKHNFFTYIEPHSQKVIDEIVLGMNFIIDLENQIKLVKCEVFFAK